MQNNDAVIEGHVEEFLAIPVGVVFGAPQPAFESKVMAMG
ncbi:MAG: hypothetical protein M2R45_01607 [Verrucomicrobia subdivision 3 bacterium]|nr:hypothetical protein [Limisphaerales bacterium]MCS1412759.1 hypothetical protein [Limisphaerales bacterium]